MKIFAALPSHDKNFSHSQPAKKILRVIDFMIFPQKINVIAGNLKVFHE